MSIGDVAAGTTSETLGVALELFWHPVCTTRELDAVGEKPFAVRLLGRNIEAVYRDLLHLEATGAAYVWARGKGNLWCAGDAIGQQ